MTKDIADPYSALVKTIAFTLNQFRLYTVEHPLVKESFENVEYQIEQFFKTKNRLTIGTMRDLLVVEGTVLDKKDSFARDLAKAFQRVGIEAMSFEKGIEPSEISRFLKLIGMRPKDIEAKGGFKVAFDAEQFRSVKLASGKFQLVAEGESVSHDEESHMLAGETHPVVEKVLSAPPTVEKMASMAEVIENIRASYSGVGQAELKKVELDCEKIVVQLEKKPQEVAELIAGEVKNTAHVESIIRNIIQHLTHGLVSFLVESGKDITKALEKFSREVEKSLRKSLGDEALDQMQGKVGKIFEETIDDYRMQMILETHAKHQDDPKAVQKILQKVLHDEKARDRMLPAVRQELTQVGFKAETFDSIFEKIEEKEASKKSKTTVDVAELAELKRKAKLYDQAGGKLGGSEEVIQQLKREKKVIQDEKERVESVIHNLAEGLLVVDKNGKVVLMNPAAEKLLGVKQSDKIGKSVSEGLHDEHMVSMTKGQLRSQDDHVAKQVEIIGINDETKRILQASTAIIENEDGKTVGMVSVLSDVTKQKEVEKIKTQFVANVSHELRTPLVAIQKSLSLILGQELGELNPDQSKFLTIAHRNIDRLSRLINDLLDVAKLEAGKMYLQPKLVPVKELMLHVGMTMETWLKDKKIKLETHFSGEDLELEADPDRLTQIVTNLLGNAIKFTPDGGTITLEAKEMTSRPEKEGAWVEISVHDSGIGIAPEDQAKIFEKFVQVSLVQPAGVSSTGLGLTIVQEIIELHGGSIHVESEAGKGSRFYFYLPKKFSLKEERKSRL